MYIVYCHETRVSVGSLTPGKFEWDFRYVIFKWILVIDGWGISSEIVLIWMSLDYTDDQSTLVHVMAWCRQAPSHYVNQCWPRSLSPYGVTRPEWVKPALPSLLVPQVVITTIFGHRCDASCFSRARNSKQNKTKQKHSNAVKQNKTQPCTYRWPSAKLR